MLAVENLTKRFVTPEGVITAVEGVSNAGLGHLAIEHYNNFRVPDLYAVLILIFVLAVGPNTLMARLMPRH